MVKETILIDTSLFIDYYRKKNKENTLLVELAKKYDFAISVITKFELLMGVKDKEEKLFWQSLFKDIIIFPLADKEVEISAEIMKYLRAANKLIGLQDVFIAATAIENRISLATLNLKDFIRVPELKLISLPMK